MTKKCKKIFFLVIIFFSFSSFARVALLPCACACAGVEVCACVREVTENVWKKKERHKVHFSIQI
jgi:hypothetical protein